MRESRKKKLYCYVDETGQDTRGGLFVVALVVSDEERDVLATQAERLEQRTGKGLAKWRKAVFGKKVEYIKAVLASPLFQGSLFFASYENTSAYLDLTILSTARAVLHKVGNAEYKATIIVDGLRASEVAHFAAALRQLRISVRKVRGMKDESNSLIRLADAICGFVRDYLEGQEYTRNFDGHLNGISYRESTQNKNPRG